MSAFEDDEKEYKEQSKIKKGYMSTKPKIEVKYVEKDLENKFISKAEFLAKRKRMKEANDAAEKARAEVLAKHGKTPAIAKEEKRVSDAENHVAGLKAQIKSMKAKIEKDPENKTLPPKLDRLIEQLDKAEDAIDA